MGDTLSADVVAEVEQCEREASRGQGPTMLDMIIASMGVCGAQVNLL